MNTVKRPLSLVVNAKPQTDNEDALPVVGTAYGRLRGSRVEIDEEHAVNTFLRVPYARPPLGLFRFREPQVPPRWEGVKDCLHHSAKAPQKELFVERFIANHVPTSEDCLYLNVFAPAWSPPESSHGFAVLVFIHGGAFAVHSSSFYGDIGICKSLCTKDVIVVTIQYRLGILGFAATGDNSCPANLGLRDQTFALRWIKENIGAFKGDPENITVSELFSRAIIISGTGNCAWAMNDVKKVARALRRHAEKIGWRCPADVDEKAANQSMIEYLRTQKVSALSLGVSSLKKRKDNLYGIDFAPVIDGDFLPEPIEELRRNTPKKQCITGTTSFEGLFFASYRERKYNVKGMKTLIGEFIRNEDDQKKALELYPTDGKSKSDIIRQYMRLYSDICVNNGLHACAEQMTNAGHSVYLYNFEYHPHTFGAMGWAFPFIEATHGTDLPYLFGKCIFTGAKFKETDLKMLDQHTTMFMNFVKTGNPNSANLPRWDPLRPQNTWRYLNINVRTEMRDNFHGRRAHFWNNLRGEDSSVTSSDGVDGGKLESTASRPKPDETQDSAEKPASRDSGDRPSKS